MTVTLLSWTRASQKYVSFPVTAVNGSGVPVSITGVDCALLPYRSRGPATGTAWTSVTWTPGVNSTPGTAQVLVCGPDVTPPLGALQMGQTGVDLWGRVVDNPEVDAFFIARIDLLSP